MKRILVLILIVLATAAFSGCNKQEQKVETKPAVQENIEKEMNLNIVTTNRLLFSMIKDVIGERHSIEYMFASKDRLWNFNYTDDSINNLSRKDLFFYWGSGIEPWIGDFVNKLGNSKAGPINISRGVKLIGYEKEVKYKDTSMKDNPYFWMNIDDYKIAMLNIKNAIQDKDTKDRDFYEANFSKTIKEVDGYQKRLKDAFEKLKDYTFLVDGDELDYFTKYFGLKTIKIHNATLEMTPNDRDEITKAEEKLAALKNVIFLYDNEQKLKMDEALISKYKLKTVNISVYRDDLSYLQLLNNNVKSLESIVLEK